MFMFLKTISEKAFYKLILKTEPNKEIDKSFFVFFFLNGTMFGSRSTSSATYSETYCNVYPIDHLL